MATLETDNIPLVILHTRVCFYRNTSIQELRAFLEPRYAKASCPEEIIRTWVTQATQWKDSLPEGTFEEMLKEYEGE